MSLLSKAARATYRARRLERAVQDPARYARNRATSKALGALGFWKLYRRLWR